MADKYILEMQGVTKRFPGVLALNNVNLHLNKGEILALCGENGAGKSTLMKVLSGSFAGDYEGNIFFDGNKVEMASVKEAEDYGIEMIYQEVNMMFDATVAENLYVGNLPGNVFVDFKKLYQDAQELLDVGKMNISARTKTRALNNGQLQMLSILRAWAKKPKILVLDEPTGALTVGETRILMEMLKELRKSGTSCIYISHKLEEVFEISDRIMVLRDGQLVSEHKTSEVTSQMLVEEMVGRKVENLYPKIDVEKGEELLRVESVTVPHPTMKGRNIVNDISFSLRRGEILGIGGLVGAGRSETLAAVFGQITKGVHKKVYIKGKEVQIHSPADAIEAGIGFVTEERKQNGFVGVLSIRENISLASLDDLPGKFIIDREVEKERVNRMFESMRIKAPSMETLMRNLSGGNQQKAVLGKWMLKKPDILFIDEPTRGIDVGAKAEIYKLMGELVEQGVGIIMVSSDMPELVSMSDRCIVFSNGHITGEFSKEELTQDRVMAAAIAE